MGKIKDKMLEDFKNSEIQVGEEIIVKDILLYPHKDWLPEAKKSTATIKSIDGDKVTIVKDYETFTINRCDCIRMEHMVGVNPMPERTWHDGMTRLGFTIGWVKDIGGVTWTDTSGIEIKGLNFNPYIIDNDGNKVYYQRELCWTLQDKQNFIESIYNDLNCGVVVIRYNSDEKIDECPFEYDIVDGKQRLHTLIEFYNDEFPDKNGYYWSDFSRVAQRRFCQKTVMDFFQFGENTSDADIKKAFLNVNFTGVPMSEDHLNFVKSINL